jgi:tetratricopeptide (TPR) repeat protein
MLIAAALALAAGGCGTAPQSPAGPVDRELKAAGSTARYAFESGRYDQAASIYRRALDRAFLRNDADAILDNRYNLAVSLMELQKTGQALALVEQAKADLAASGKSLPADLLLLEATILFRDGRMQRALKVTEAILASGSAATPAIHARTHFLRGLIAARRNDVPMLRRSIRRMGRPENDILLSDLAELRGRLAMAEEAWRRAASHLKDAARLRRHSLDYRRMARSLALAAAASRKAGREGRAASLYLQAGRSAALRGDRSEAREWLTQAARLFESIGNSELSAESRSLLADLAQDLDQGETGRREKVPPVPGTPSVTGLPARTGQGR